MHFLADGVVLFAELDKLGKLAFEQLHFFAQAERLALRERNRMPAVGMRHVDRFEQLGMALEQLGKELWIVLEVLLDFVRVQWFPRIRRWRGPSSRPDCCRPPKLWSIARRVSRPEPASRAGVAGCPPPLRRKHRCRTQ